MNTYFISHLFRDTNGTLRPCLAEITALVETPNNLMIGSQVDYLGHYPLPVTFIHKSDFVLHETFKSAVIDLQAQCRKTVDELTGLIETLETNIQSFELLV